MPFPLLLAATALTAGSQFLSGQQNKTNAEAEGRYALQKAALDADRFERDAARLRGKQTAIANKAGRPLTSGTIAQLLHNCFPNRKAKMYLIQ